tara:strand:- start:24035 stop:31678 length:7644 start_codon:yes stop_codon:yes gene_type:complete
MANLICPPSPGNGAGTFSDKLVGYQITDGTAQFTMGNFTVTNSTSSKQNREFEIGVFGGAITLENLNVKTLEEAAYYTNNSLKIFFNYNKTKITNFTLYGSLRERFRVAVQQILYNFPAALNIVNSQPGFIPTTTFSAYTYDLLSDTSKLVVPYTAILNPFNIEFTKKGNLPTTNDVLNPLRNFSKEYANYVLDYSGLTYEILEYQPITYFADLNKASQPGLKITVKGDPFNFQTTTMFNRKGFCSASFSAGTWSPILDGYDNLPTECKIVSGRKLECLPLCFPEYLIRPSDFKIEELYKDTTKLGEIETYLINRKSVPEYKALFDVPAETPTGRRVTAQKSVTWTKMDPWNIVISGDSYGKYLTDLYELGDEFDSYKTNLISRFLTTAALKEFDTSDKRVEKILQLYGREFDEVKKYIEGLAFMANVDYSRLDNVPDKLLKNLAQTIGWGTPSSITKDSLLEAVFGGKRSNATPKESLTYKGTSINEKPAELDADLYRRLVINSAYLFKSKGTRKALEFIFKLVGAPEALVEFNEHVYVGAQKINMSQFNAKWSLISGGSYTETIPVLSSTTYFDGVNYWQDNVTTGQTITNFNSFSRDQYPVSEEGYPTMSNGNYFQRGSGWFEETTSHRGAIILDTKNSTFTGASPDVKTVVRPFTYGQPYLDTLSRLPNMDFGFNLLKKVDNKKAWIRYDNAGSRRVYDLKSRGTYYNSPEEKLVINVKNVDILMNVGQGPTWGVWDFSRKYGVRFNGDGLKNIGTGYTKSTYQLLPFSASTPFTLPWPGYGGTDFTEVVINATKQSFFEFADNFYKVLINVKNRQTIDDGKGGGYPTLKRIYLEYLKANHFYNKGRGVDNTVGSDIPNGQYTYGKMLDFVEEMGDYWIRLAEQFVPATTIWHGGTKIENSAFDRQKLVYKRNFCLSGQCDNNAVTSYVTLPSPVLPNKLLREGFSGTTAPVIQTELQSVSRWVTSFIGNLTGVTATGAAAGPYCQIPEFNCACIDTTQFPSYAPYTPTMNSGGGYPWQNGSVNIEIFPDIILKNLTGQQQAYFMNTAPGNMVGPDYHITKPNALYNYEAYKMKLNYTGETIPMLSTGAHVDLDLTSIFAKRIQNMLQSNVYCDPNDPSKIAPCADTNLMSGSTLFLADEFGGRYKDPCPIIFGTNPEFSWNTYSSPYVGGSPFMVQLFGIPIPLQPTGQAHTNDEYTLEGCIGTTTFGLPCVDLLQGIRVEIKLQIAVKDKFYGSYNTDVNCNNLPNASYAPSLQTGFAYMSGSSLGSGWEDNTTNSFTGGTNGAIENNCEKQQLLPYIPQFIATVYDWGSKLPAQYGGSFSSGYTVDSASTVSDCYSMINLQQGPIFSNNRYGCVSVDECGCKELTSANLILEGLRSISPTRKTALLSPCCLGDKIILNLYWWKKNETEPTMISFNINKTQFIRTTVYDAKVGIDTLQLRIPTNALEQIISNPYVGRGGFIQDQIESDIILEFTGNTVSGINLNINQGQNTSNGITQPSYWQNFLNRKDKLKGGKISGANINKIIPSLTFGNTSNDGWDIDLYISCQNTQLEELSIKVKNNNSYLENDPVISPCLTNCSDITLMDLGKRTIYKKEKLSEVIENSGKLIFDYKEFFKVNYPETNIKDFVLVGSEIYNTLKQESLELTDCDGKTTNNRQIIYNAPLNSGNTINSDFRYLTFYTNGEEQVKTSWLRSLRDLYYVDVTCDGAINVEFSCPEQQQDFNYGIQSKQVGSVELDYFLQSGDTSSLVRKYEDLNEWVKRGLGPTGFSNSVIYYDHNNMIDRVKIGPEYRYSLESPYWTSIRSIEEEFIASQYGTATTQNYTGYTTGTTACAGYTFPVGYSSEVCCAKCATGSIISPSDPCYAYCVSGCCSGDTVTYELNFNYSAFTGSTLIPFGQRNSTPPNGYVADTLLDSDDANMKTFIGNPVYNNNGGPLVYSGENPTQYVTYKPIKSNHFRFQYRGILDVNYLDDGWKNYVKTNYLDNTGQGYPLNDYQFKRLINASIINKGGVSNLDSVSEGVESNEYTATPRLGKVAPYYGYASGTGIQDFYFKAYVEIKYGSGGTKTIGQTTVGSNSYKYPDTDANLTLVANNVETGLNNVYSTTFSGDTTFNKKFDIYVDTGDWYVTTGDTVILKYETRWDTNSKSGDSKTKFTIKLGGDYSDTALARAPWYRVTKSIGKAIDTKNLIWKRCTTSDNYSWKTPDNIILTSNEMGSLYLTNTGYTPTTVDINSRTFNNQTFLDIPTEAYVGNLKWQSTTKPTNLWGSAINNHGSTKQPRILDYDYPTNTPSVYVDKHNYRTTWNLPQCVTYSGSNCCSPQLPCIEHRYIQKNTFKSVCSNSLFEHYIVYDPVTCDVSNCTDLSTPIDNTSINDIYTIESNPIGSGSTIYFSGNEIIINNKPVNIKSATASGNQILKSKIQAPDLNQIDYREQLNKAEENRRQGKVVLTGLIYGGVSVIGEQIFKMGKEGKLKINKKYTVTDIIEEIQKVISELTDPTLTPADKKKKRCKKCGGSSGVGGCVLGGCLEFTGFPPDGIKITWTF